MESPPPASTAACDPAPSPSTPPITYVQTDVATFKELVQRLTGPHDDVLATAANSPSPKLAGVRRPAFKLHERRQASRSKLASLKPLVSPQISPIDLVFSSGTGRSPMVSPSTQLSVLSISDGTGSPIAMPPKLNEEEEEEKAIRERRFYLHPSPRSGRRSSAEPELLPLFPLTSPGAK